MRVLLVTSEYPPVHFGGLGTAVAGLTQALDDAGVPVTILLIHGEGAYPYAYGYGYGYRYGHTGAHGAGRIDAVAAPPGVEVVHLSFAQALVHGPALAAARGVEIVHLHSSWLWDAAEAIRARAGIPVVYTVHSLDRAEVDNGEWLPHGSIQDRAIAGADRLIVLSESERSLIARHYPAALPRARIAGNGIDPARHVWRPRRAARSAVLYVGRFGTRKGVRDVFEAVPGVLARVPAARFVFVGGASPADGPREAAAWVPPKLRAHLDHMAFLGWRNPWTETAKDWYVLGDVLVVPSRYEPFGMVVLEGMLRGRLVVAANTGGPSELLEHERTGLLYRAGDVDEMVDMLCRALVDRDLGRRVKRAARREVRSNWSWEAVLPAVHRVYAEVAAARPTRSFAPRP